MIAFFKQNKKNTIKTNLNNTFNVNYHSTDKSNNIQYRKTQQGFTIVELLVSMILGLFLLGSMTALFLNNRSLIVTQNNTAKIFDDSRFSLFLIENDLALSGFRGCSSGPINIATGTTFNSTAGSANYYNNTNFIQGSQGNGTAFSPALDSAVSGLSPTPSAGMDSLTIRTNNGEPAVLTADMANATASPAVTSSSGFVAGGYGIISNCYTSSLFKVSSVGATSITPTLSLVSVYPTGSQVYPYNTIVYYVGGDNTLYRSLNGGTPSPIAYNVEKFSALYGLDTDANGNVNKYVFAPAVTDFKQVVSVRIGIVIKSNDINTTGSAKSSYSYKFNGTTYTPADGKLRKVYYTTIALRNMLP